MHSPHKRAVLIWLAIYPLITVLFYLLQDMLILWPIPVRTLVLTLIAVPLVVYVILPFYGKVFRRWLEQKR